MTQGVAGKILRVNLSSRQVSTDEPEESFYRRYLGGAGFISYYLLKEVPQGIDPLSSENKLIFAVGLMTGMAMPGAGRNAFGAKSPLTMGFAKAEVGGWCGWELKRAGFDSLIVEGKADHPVYIWVHDGQAEIRDASLLWGKTVLEAHDAIAAELGDKLVRSAMIGPGGENMARMACIICDLRNAAGRGGMGAVMGSKNLKGIIVKGRRAPQVADPTKLQELAKWMNNHYGEVNIGLLSRHLHETGTGDGAMMRSSNEIGNLPVRNWGDGFFENVDKITATMIKDTIRVGMEACPACNIRCKKQVEFQEPYPVDRRNGGPEYETLAALGSLCGVDDLKAISKANALCSLYSLDTISTGGTIAFAMECFENEIIGPSDTGGLDLRFGNAEAMVQAVELIAHRQGIGNILAEGTRIAAQKIGRGAEDYAIHVKGLELPMHEPRLKQGMGIVYSVEAHGADHCAGYHDTAYTKEGTAIDHLRGVGAVGPLPVDDLSPAKVANVKAQHALRLFQDSLGMCYFVPWSVTQAVEIIRAITGWNYTVHEAVQQGERVAAMSRAYNLREGFTAADDHLPKRFFSPTPRGGLKATAIDPVAMDQAIHNFYAMLGWDKETGVPTQEKLEELGVGWVAGQLPAARPPARSRR